jgi:hypothetical protein
MPLILRADVDKPFGRAGLFQKVISKAREDFYFPAWSFLGYGRPASILASYLHDQAVPGHFFFRLCTLPTRDQLNQILRQGHKIGLHAENTRCEETFLAEVAAITGRLSIDRVEFFTKHGSGQLKLGRRHYPPYEEDKYILWAERHGIEFPFGNGIISSGDWMAGEFIRDMFWLNHQYRDIDQYPLGWAIEQAKDKTLAVIVHPENYIADLNVRNDLKQLIKLARLNNISWVQL